MIILKIDHTGKGRVITMTDGTVWYPDYDISDRQVITDGLANGSIRANTPEGIKGEKDG